MKTYIKIPKEELVKEHKNLIKVLKTGDKKKLKKEAKKQESELKNYIEKAHVKTYMRLSKSGKMVAVREHDDKRTKRAELKHYISSKKRTAVNPDVKEALNIPKPLAEKISRVEKGHGQEITLTKKEVLQVLNKVPTAFVSAGRNPNSEEDKKLTDEQIIERDKKLRGDLIQLGYKFMRVKGKYGEEEESYMVMVPHADRKDMVKLGQKHNQDSILYTNHGTNEYIFTTGQNKGLKNKGKGFMKMGDDADNYYTEVKTPKGVVKFSLNLNFDKLFKKAIEGTMKHYISFEKANPSAMKQQPQKKAGKIQSQMKNQNQEIEEPEFENKTEHIQKELKHLNYIKKNYPHVCHHGKLNNRISKLKRAMKFVDDMVGHLNGESHYIELD